MNENKFYKTAFFAMVLMAIFHLVSLKFFLYWSLPWIDIFPHFFGGYFISGVLLYFLKNSKNKKFKNIIIIFAVTILAFFWEIFELKSGITSISSPNYFLQSFLDILFGFLGGFFAIILSINLFKKDVN